jgi:hypothetical protein
VNGRSSRSPTAITSPSRAKHRRAGRALSPIARQVPRLIQIGKSWRSAKVTAQPM